MQESHQFRERNYDASNLLLRSSNNATAFQPSQPSAHRLCGNVISSPRLHVGSPYDKENAEWILSQFKEWGFDARIETFSVLFPTPKERVVELREPTKL